MARKFLVPIEMAQNEIRNAVIQVTTTPSSPAAGQIYYDSTKKELGLWNGTEWKYLGTVEGATGSTSGVITLAGDLAGTATSPTVKNLHLTGDTAVGHKLTEVSEPTSTQDAATKAYVDAKINGLQWKQPVVVATAAALVAVTPSGSETTHKLEANASGILEVDGVKIETLGERVLVKNQAEAKDNGIYTLTKKGEAGANFVLTRAADCSTEAQMLDATVFAEKGTVNADHAFNLTSGPPITVETTAIEFVEIPNISVVGDGVYTTLSGSQLKIKQNTSTATLPGNGLVSSITKGTATKAIAAVTGEGGTKKEFKIAHGLESRYVNVQVFENSGGNPSVPVEVDWEPTSASEVKIEFAVAPTAGTSFHIAIWG